MKTQILLSLTTLMTGSLLAADSSSQNAVATAVKNLGQKANYSWTTTTVVPEGTRWRPGPLDGKAEKGGVMNIRMTFGDNTSQAFIKGDKGAVTNPDGGWQSLTEMENSDGGRFWARMLRVFRAPVAQAEDLLADTRELKKDGEAYAGELTEEGAKSLLTFRPRGASATEGLTASDAKGSVKFWIKDGVLTKYETKVTGKVKFNDNERDVDRTTITEIKDVGSTKLEVPAEARKKLD